MASLGSMTTPATPGVEVPRWIAETPVDADLAPEAVAVEACAGDHVDPADGMDGVDLPDNLAATEDYGDDGTADEPETYSVAHGDDYVADDYVEDEPNG